MSEKRRAMHVAKSVRRHGERVYTSFLVRRSVREGKRVRHVTVANVSGLPAEAIEALRIVCSRPHGHAEAVLTMARRHRGQGGSRAS